MIRAPHFARLAPRKTADQHDEVRRSALRQIQHPRQPLTPARANYLLRVALQAAAAAQVQRVID